MNIRKLLDWRKLAHLFASMAGHRDHCDVPALDALRRGPDVLRPPANHYRRAPAAAGAHRLFDGNGDAG